MKMTDDVITDQRARERREVALANLNASTKEPSKP